MPKDPDIKRRMDHLEEIIDQLDADDVSLEDGRDLYDEGQELLAEILDHLQDGKAKSPRSSDWGGGQRIFPILTNIRQVIADCWLI